MELTLVYRNTWGSNDVLGLSASTTDLNAHDREDTTGSIAAECNSAPIGVLKASVDIGRELQPSGPQAVLEAVHGVGQVLIDVPHGGIHSLKLDRLVGGHGGVGDLPQGSVWASMRGERVHLRHQGQEDKEDAIKA